MFCPKCGREAADDQAFCPGCGTSLSPAASSGVPAAPVAGISPKSKLAATLLCSIPALFGMFGIHRVYIGKVGTGVTMIILSVVAWITVWVLIGIPIFIGMLVWAIIDFANIVTDKMTDSDGLRIQKW